MSKFIPNKFGRPALDPQQNSYRLDHGSVDEFYISLDDPHKSWAPGEEICGQVILRSRKNLANLAIKFNLSGYVKIHALPHSKLRPMKTVLFSHTIQIYGPNSNVSSDQEFANGLYKGEHRFPFIVKLPNKRIFTSIDFGKGAIVYVLLTHLSSADGATGGTRSSILEQSPPSVREGEVSSLFKAREALAKIHSPTFSYEKIISLVNPVDVAYLPSPKRKRLIIKDPRKGKLLRVQSSSLTINTFATFSSANSDPESIGFSAAHTALEVLGPAPGPIIAPTSQISSPQNPPPSPGTPTSIQHQGRLSSFSMSGDTIRVLMDVPERGYLRGELIPIKLSINHLRKIQDSTGIIVTLVRVCRIDYGPDGYYESFRKDLQQLVIPLFVDPITFSLEISTSMRVPPDAFPTISGCPLVSFQYFIEVMLNLSGKSMSLTTPSEQPKSNVVVQDDSTLGLSPGQTAPVNYNFQSLAQSRSEFINTDKFKRLKKFLQMTTEVVIGTHRLIKPMGEEAEFTQSTNDLHQAASSHSISQSHSPLGVSIVPTGGPIASAINSVPELRPMDNFDSPPYLYESTHPSSDIQAISPRDIPTYEDAAVSPPEPELPVLSEKERVRQHEASLLPSAPPLDDESEDGSDASESELPDVHLDIHRRSGLDDLGAHVQGHIDSTREHESSVDDLYQVPDIHEGIGLEGPKDYVPNYNAAANDRLVDSNQ